MTEVLRIVKKISSQDHSAKFIFSTRHDDYLEAISLHIPLLNPSRAFCISTQIGCPVGCSFCASGSIKLLRNLEDTEILKEIELLSCTIPETKKFRVAFMGVGEPLMNYNNVISAIQGILNTYSNRCKKIFLSTVGIPSYIKKLARDTINIEIFALQISLNFSHQAKRALYMPFSATYSIEHLIESGQYYIEYTKRKIAFSYLMLDGINDSEKDLINLMKLLSPVRKSCILKLSVYNNIGNCMFSPSNNAMMVSFKKKLQQAGFEARIFKSHAIEVIGGCGQLIAQKYHA